MYLDFLVVIKTVWTRTQLKWFASDHLQLGILEHLLWTFSVQRNFSNPIDATNFWGQVSLEGDYSGVPITRAGSIKQAGRIFTRTQINEQGGKMDIFSMEMVASREEFLEI